MSSFDYPCFLLLHPVIASATYKHIAETDDAHLFERTLNGLFRYALGFDPLEDSIQYCIGTACVTL